MALTQLCVLAGYLQTSATSKPFTQSNITSPDALENLKINEVAHERQLADVESQAEERQSADLVTSEERQLVDVESAEEERHSVDVKSAAVHTQSGDVELAAEERQSVAVVSGTSSSTIVDSHCEDLSLEDKSIVDTESVVPNSHSDQSQDIPVYQSICDHLKLCNVCNVDAAISKGCVPLSETNLLQDDRGTEMASADVDLAVERRQPADLATSEERQSADVELTAEERQSADLATSEERQSVDVQLAAVHRQSADLATSEERQSADVESAAVHRQSADVQLAAVNRQSADLATSEERQSADVESAAEDRQSEDLATSEERQSVDVELTAEERQSADLATSDERHSADVESAAVHQQVADLATSDQRQAADVESAAVLRQSGDLAMSGERQSVDVESAAVHTQSVDVVLAAEERQSAAVVSRTLSSTVVDSHCQDLSLEDESIVDTESVVPNSHSDQSQDIPVYQSVCDHLNLCNVDAASSKGSEPSFQRNLLEDDRGTEMASADVESETEDRQSADVESEAEERQQAGCKSMVVSKVVKTSRRIWDKQLACYFCGKLLKNKISEHLIRVHSDETDVAQVMAKPVGSVERKVGWEKLKNLGNFNHNVQTLSVGSGQVIVRRRCTSEDPGDFIPCEFCYGFFRCRVLWKHVRKCALRPAVVDKTAPSYDAVANGRLLLEAASPVTSSSVDVNFRRAVLDNMRTDSLTSVVRKDNLIMKFGSVLFKKLGRYRAHDISQRMRQLGRLKLKIQEVSKSAKQLTRYINGRSFDIVIAAVEKLCSLSVDDSGRRTFGNPSLALKLGHSLAKCAQVQKGIAIREDNVEMRQEAESYLGLHNPDYSDMISSPALSTLKCRKHNKPLELPLTEDLIKLKQYLERKLVDLTSKLRTSPCHSTWRQLADVVLSRVLTFNKRRGGEASRLLLDAYTSRPRWDLSANTELLNSLQPLEKQLMKRSVAAALFLHISGCIQISSISHSDKYRKMTDFDH